MRRGVLLDAAGVPALGRPETGWGQSSPFSSYVIMASQLEQLNLISVHERGFSGTGVGIAEYGFPDGYRPALPQRR